jgi:hypothetical protein
VGLLRSVTARLSPGLALLLLGSGALAAPTPVSEYQVKAVYLFNFAQFVEWPAAALPRDSAPFVIGVLGKDPFGTALEDVVRTEAVNQHPLAIAHYRSVAEIHDCQILFITASEVAHLDGILTALKDRSILTVADALEPGQHGVMIELVRQDSRIRLRIDLQAAKAADLTISSKLLRPAEIVGPRS